LLAETNCRGGIVMTKKSEEVKSDVKDITVEELASSLDNTLSTPDGYNKDFEINLIAC
jgi:hypothetical protein